MTTKLLAMLQLFKSAASAWSDDKASSRGASLAYYTVFSMGPLILIAIAVAGLAFGREAAQHRIVETLQGLLGNDGAKAIEETVRNASRPNSGIIATLVGVVSLLFGATGVFGEMQDALNSIWHVKPKAGRGVWLFVRERILSFALVFATGFVLLVSLIVTAGLAALGKFLSGSLAGGAAFWHVLNFMVSFAVVTGLFATIFKFVPRVRVRWRDVWWGAALSAVLFSLGRLGLGVYLAKTPVASAFGAAGSLIIVLVWVYYSAQIFYFGAEFSRAQARARGIKLEARRGAELADEAAPAVS